MLKNNDQTLMDFKFVIYWMFINKKIFSDAGAEDGV